MKITQTWRFVSRFLIALGIIYFYPVVKHWLFPDQMTRLEKMSHISEMEECQLAIVRQSKTKMLLTISSGNRIITTEIFRDAIRELEPADNTLTFFAHAINRDDSGVFYLSRTRIETDSKLQRVRRIEVSVCDRIQNQTGQVSYKGIEPIYVCEVPVQEAICVASN